MQKINDLLRKKSGIYSIMNIANGKIYIGSSKDIYNRLHEHLHLLNANSAHNKHLQNAWNKYGQECFIYNVLELCSENSRFEKEQYYMDFMNPEYNKTSQVIANFGQTTSEEVREKISKTLKEKYKSGELRTYKQEHAWIPIYIYNIHTLKLVAECKCRADALRLLYNNAEVNYREWSLVRNTYTMSETKLHTEEELLNAVNKNIKKYKTGGYLIGEFDGNTFYYRTTTECFEHLGVSKSMIMKNKNATKDFPYCPKKFPVKIYFSDIYIPVKGRAVPIEESLEELSGNIGEKLELELRD